MFVCLWICVFLFCSLWDTHRKFPWDFHEDMTWFGWDILDIKCLYVCLFVDGFVCFFFVLIIVGKPRGGFPKSFMMIRNDMVELFRIYFFICLFVNGFGFFCFEHRRTPIGSFPVSLWRPDLIWLRYFGSKNVNLFVCLLMDLFLCFILFLLGHPKEVSLKVLWRSNLIWLKYLRSKKFICLFFVCLFFMYSFVFCFHQSGTPTECFPESLAKIRLDLAEIFRILKIEN